MRATRAKRQALAAEASEKNAHVAQASESRLRKRAEAADLAALNIDKRLQGQPLAEASVRFTFARTHIGLAE